MAPTATVQGEVTIGARAVILFGAVVRAEPDRIEIGPETNVQDNSVLHCDEGAPCLVGRRVTVGHSAVVHGAVVGDESLIGIGAIVLNRAEIGEGAWVAAGSVVSEGTSIPSWMLAVGTPARPLRELSAADVARARSGVDHYLDLAEAYRRSLTT